MKKIVPKLRFKEFKSEWKELKLSNIAVINPKNNYLPDEFIYIDLESVNKGILSKKNIVNKNNAPSRAQRTVLLNDILFQTVRPYQQNNYFVNTLAELPYIASTGYALIRTTEIPYFIYTILHKKTFLNKVLDMCTGTSFPAINSNDLGTIDVKIPEKEEQEKISILLKLLDKKIELQQEKIENLKLYSERIKKKLLKQDYRFREFKQKWENNYIENICKVQTGKSNTQDKCDNGIYPFYIRSEKMEKSNKYIFDCEAVLTIGDGNIGKVFFYENGKFDCHQRVYVLNNIKIYGKYLYYYFSTFFYKRAMSMSAKNTVDSVRQDMITKMSISIPIKEEQVKISKFLELIDRKIKLSEENLNKLNQYKKYLLKNMFI